MAVSLGIQKTLRERTSSLHKLTETVHWSDNGFSGRNGYRQFLWSLACAHLRYGLPAAVVRNERAGLLHEQTAITRLSEDLRIPLPKARTRDEVPNIHHAWGVGYTLTGSVLGAVTILRSDAVLPSWSVRYLEYCAEYAMQGGVRRFMDALERAQPVISSAHAGAADVFAEIRAPSWQIPKSASE